MGSSGYAVSVPWLVGTISTMLVWAGKDTDEELAHYVKKEPSTDMPWTSNEIRINKMIEEEIIKFNYAPETTESPFDSQGNPRPTEGRHPTWWNAYRQAKEGDRPDWSAEISDLIKNPRTYPPWTPSQESEPMLSKFKNIEPFTWRPGAPVINLRLKTDATTRHTSEPQETTTERSMVLSAAHWDTSEDGGGGGGGGGGTDPPLNLASLKKGFKEDSEYLKVRPKTRQEDPKRHKSQIHNRKYSSDSQNVKNTLDRVKSQKVLKEEEKSQKEFQMKRRRSSKSRYQNANFPRIW